MPESQDGTKTRAELLEGAYLRYRTLRRRRLLRRTVTGVAACSLMVVGASQLLMGDGPARRIVIAAVDDDATPSPAPNAEPASSAPSDTRPSPAPAPTTAPGPVAMPRQSPRSLGGGIVEYPISYMIGYGNSLTSGPDGAVWFIKGFGNNALIRMAADGAVTEFPTSLPPEPGALAPGAVDLAAGPDGALWFVEDKQIGRMTTEGTVTRFPIPGSPSALATFGGGIGAPPGQTGASSIVAGPDGALWFNETWGDRIGRVTTAGEVSEFDLPTHDSAFQGPRDLAVGADGALWFTSLSRRVWRLDPSSKTFRSFDMPAEIGVAHLDDIAAGGDGALWMASGDTLLRLTTGGRWTKLTLPAPQSPPQFPNTVRLTPGPDGNLWFTSKDRNAVGYVGRDGHVTEIPLSTPDRSPVGITSGPDGALWFSMQGGIGSVRPTS